MKSHMSTYDVEYPQHAGLVLKFVVVGGGLSGFAAAYTLRKAGHEVTLVERTDGTARYTGGLRSPPNMTKLLMQWGLGPRLENNSHECKRISFCLGHTGEKVGILNINDDFLNDLSAEFLFIKAGELQDWLYQIGKEAGVNYKFNSTVVGAEVQIGTVKLADGTTVQGDLVIAADGYDSVFRRFILGEDEYDDQEKYLEIIFTVPSELLAQDPDLRPLVDDLSACTCYLGDGYVIQTMMLNSGATLAVNMEFEYSGPIGPDDMKWRDDRGFEHFQLDFKNFTTTTRKLLNLVTGFSSRIFLTRPCPETQVCDSSKVILVGDAAHPVLPGGHHCAALALEGAQTLGSLFSRIQCRDDISRLVTAYDEIRTPRCNYIQDYFHKHSKIYKARHGPMQQARDARFRRTLVQNSGEHMEEALFREVWGTELAIFAHDATEAVDDWWGQWGSIVVRNPKRGSILSNVEISVSNEPGVAV